MCGARCVIAVWCPLYDDPPARFNALYVQYAPAIEMHLEDKEGVPIQVPPMRVKVRVTAQRVPIQTSWAGEMGQGGRRQGARG